MGNNGPAIPPQLRRSIFQLGFTTNLSAYRNVQETWLAACECPAYREPLAAQKLPWP